jgi:hypothetical protein
MSKRKLYPDECPVFEVVRTFGHDFALGQHVAGCGKDEDFPAQTWFECYGDRPGIPGTALVQTLEDEDLRPLTPAAVEMWEHVAGREWKP